MAYSTTSNGLTATAGDGSVYSPRQFTATAWLLWTLIPPLALSALAWVTDYAEQSAGNTNPASVTAGIGAALIMILLLTPIVTTLQWLILRRAWPGLVWLAWLLVVVLSVFASVVAEPIVLMKTAAFKNIWDGFTRAKIDHVDSANGDDLGNAAHSGGAR